MKLVTYGSGESRAGEFVSGPGDVFVPDEAHRSESTHAGSDRRSNRGAALAIAFGTADAMWAAGYFGRIPPPHGWLPPAGLLAAFVIIQFAGGFILGVCRNATWITALLAGAGTSLINLLILGSLLREEHNQGEIASGVAGLIILSAVLSLAGFALGRWRGASSDVAINWTGRLAKVAAFATFILVIAGGLVTGHEAGLAVVDWPNTEGNLMFLYPLAKMTGGVYYEHAHRLYGALVGLTTIALAFQIWRTTSPSLAGRGLGGGWHLQRQSPPPPQPSPSKRVRESAPHTWLRCIALVAVVLVIVQGILGGLRVTGEFTLSDDPAQTSPNLALAIVHGVLAQVFLGLIVAIAALTSTTWAQTTIADHASTNTTRKLASALVAILLLQLVLGATYRHLNASPDFARAAIHAVLGLHIVMAFVVLLTGFILGIQLRTTRTSLPVLRTLGGLLLIAIHVQVILGIVAVVLVLGRRPALPTEQIPSLEIITTTAHQATGALLLSLAILIAMWVRRVL